MYVLDCGCQNLIFRYLQNRSRIQVWLYEQVNMRIEGCIIGFDEYMNLVLDDAEEVHMKTKNRKPLGRIMLKGDNITLLQSVSNWGENGDIYKLQLLQKQLGFFFFFRD